MIPSSTIQQIIEAARIEEIIGDFIVLKRRGTNMIALCPFHNEKTPSFHVSPAKGIYKCFGCGKAGNSVNFVMEHEHFTYPEALKYIAKKYDIEIEEIAPSPEESQQADERESLFNLLGFAQKYFTDNLIDTDEGKAIGLSYFTERGFSKNTIQKFQLGYSSEKWELFSDHAVQSGYKPEYLIKTGLSAQRTTNFENRATNLYDIYRGRVIFPIHNLSGRVIGFGGRILTSDKTKPKYINSPESEIYHKSDVLYGLYFAKNAIIKHNNCLLVEGYTDVISLHQSGIENVVASSGTSLTVGQIKLIKRYTPNITILYDGDDAGIKASFRGIDMILQEGMNVRVVLFPDGDDPDSYAKNHRPQEVLDFIDQKSTDFIEFKTNLLYKDIGNDPVRKASLIKEILNSISLIPDVITRTEYIKTCSKLVNISEPVLIQELNKLLTKSAFKNQRSSINDQQTAINEYIPEATEYIAEKQIPVEQDIFESQEKEIIKLLLAYGDQVIFKEERVSENKEPVEFIDVNVATYITENLKDECDSNGNPFKFNNVYYQSIFDEITKSLTSDNESLTIINEQYFLNHPDNNIRSEAIDILSSQFSLSKNWKEMHKMEIPDERDKLKESVVMSVLSLKLKWVSSNIDEINKMLKANTIPEKQDEYLSLLLELIKIRNTIASELARPILK